MNQHEMFLQGKPLTPELAEMANPKQKEEEAPDPLAADDVLKPFNKRERKRLGRLQGSEDWALAMRALDRRIEMARDRAIILSIQDPAGNPKAVVDAWTYIKSFIMIRQELDSIIDAAARGQDDEKGMGEQRRTA
jgi:hypothetical protein